VTSCLNLLYHNLLYGVHQYLHRILKSSPCLQLKPEIYWAISSCGPGISNILGPDRPPCRPCNRSSPPKPDPLPPIPPVLS
jgi:hypothetical protein